ncbi:hypothetical protein [Cytobacillus horneckiae]|uniref:Uncharacterized protein n=2 Tax=Cytobacillus horneckiae TaxID=549687 RepID=A0A2N0ZAG7_9BACI|nr:hypothetical protein [Cytobacillus horneckiae]MEC1154985.1 hypothetical protein [Cytobacillus horneckiae]MED2936109.1 hypothetical protein [Cytobacillus horneckiae]PKG26502.1 hypothetical protein CWS20_23890 [Cytobacillus horneckiae]
MVRFFIQVLAFFPSEHMKNETFSGFIKYRIVLNNSYYLLYGEGTSGLDDKMYRKDGIAFEISHCKSDGRWMGH